MAHEGESYRKAPIRFHSKVGIPRFIFRLLERVNRVSFEVVSDMGTVQGARLSPLPKSWRRRRPS